MKSSSLLSTVVALALLTGSISALASSMYRWVDDQGNVHYGENPPTGVESEQIHSYSPPPGGREQRQEAPRWQRDEDEQEPAETADAEAGADTDPGEEYCEQHRHNLQELQTRTVVRTEDPETGEQKVLSQEEREDMIRETEEALEACD